MRTNTAVDRCQSRLEIRSSILETRVVFTVLSAMVFVVLSAPATLAGAPGPESDETDASMRPAITLDPSSPVMSTIARPRTRVGPTPRPVLDPSARLLDGDDASEAWTLYIELDSGHRITQRFLLVNAGPGKHNAVAVGHLAEAGRAPYRYVNGRRRPRWTLSEDGLFFDIAASHLDLHRPKGELRITKDDIEIRLFFDLAETDPSTQIPTSRLPPGYHVEVLAVAAPTHGTVLAPWMEESIQTRGHAWLIHSWTNEEESSLLSRRVEIFGRDGETSFYGIQLRGRGDWESAWSLLADRDGRIIESPINVTGGWTEAVRGGGSKNYPTPIGFEIRDELISGQISLGPDWLRFDPLEVIPQPFRWFIRRKSKPREVWADARIGVSISRAPDPPSLPSSGETLSVQTEEASRSKRETEDETAERSVTGVASITFLNPIRRR